MCFSVVKCILVASPGFVKDQFISYLFKEAVRQDCKILLENRSKFMMVHSSSGHKYSLKGQSSSILCSPFKVGMCKTLHFHNFLVGLSWFIAAVRNATRVDAMQRHCINQYLNEYNSIQ